tara:strand:+ start:268 stop:420 length:153 start_codon:yes stop_codon:yes gene_type:complete
MDKVNDINNVFLKFIMGVYIKYTDIPKKLYEKIQKLCHCVKRSLKIDENR